MERIRESKNINVSLYNLSHIIKIKSENLKTMFLPYRNSVLTKILKNSIGGNALTSIIICVDPHIDNIEKTLSTLHFGIRASRIRN